TPANAGQLAPQWTFQTGVVNKFEATPIVIDGVLYVTGPLNHAWAIDARTGRQLWHYQRQLPPGLKVCCGMVNRGFAAYGDRLWRFYTIPAPGEPGSDSWKGEIWQRGGGPTWLTGTYDPQLNLLYWGVGNPNPDWDGASRPGDNLYTGSLVALDPDTGKMKWHYQYTPHDTHDWDANEIPVLADITINGRARKVVMMGNRNGF